MELNDLINRSFENALDEVVRNVIQARGWGIDSEVKQVIKEEAKKIMAEPEMRKILRDRMIDWIKVN